MSDKSSFNMCQKASDVTLNLCNNESVQNMLKCSFCDKFLSLPPIYSHEKETICGRCKFVDNAEGPKWYRQTVYESVAQFMMFPCSNSFYGCKSQLKWGEVEEHENTCLYKKLSCPFSNSDIFPIEKCRWLGSGPGLNEHLENHHGDLIKKVPEINFCEAKCNMIFLARILKQLMIITIKYEADTDKYSCLVMVNGTSADCEAYRYQLELYDENRKNSLILRRSRLEDAVGFEENLINSDKMLIVQLPIVSDLLKRPTVIMGRFGIIKKSKKELNSSQSLNVSGQETTLDESFLRELECPVCKNYMVPPIHLCSKGHSFCFRCRDQMDVCPTCRHPIHDGRNYTLEKITASLSYPCIYKEAGCSVTCSSDKLKEHEQECSFSGNKCFLSCRMGPIVNMFKHLNDKHQDCLIVSGDLHILDVGEENLKYFAMCFGNDIFRLTVDYNDESIKFALHQFGVKQSNYFYELEIICSTECTEKMTITKECPAMNNTDALHKCITVSSDMIEKFISEEDLIFFKVHLRKNV